ncbi:helix-turn-helix transcriptional regulator [Kutzneria albida]|uniref:DNA-binding protein n=1 Tax=Kutzneria albida DSM 43870 TaxID=1449976 RepID=W5W699_9PSEU|nr:helix-turn-helix transcriptional regulator [Kutzneria albida]AHH96723.1 DNA-binding protein [Kutzneria albida DSM 43870]
MAQDIGEFLRSRRARIQPAEVGLPSFGRRRVPGLRREELAQLAGVSVDYYVRLEQGRSPTVSDAVLDAIAGALRLDDTERVHLRNLVRPAKRSRSAPQQQRVRPIVQRTMDMMEQVPAFVLGRRMQILAWNALADALYGYSTQSPEFRNSARHTFLWPGAREFYPDWPTVAAEAVALLRLDAGNYPEDPELAALIGELSMKSPEFRTLWAQHAVKQKTNGAKRINHPLVGELELSYVTMALRGDSDQVLITYAAPAGSPAEERLRLLASWQATEHPTRESRSEVGEIR